MWVHIHPLLGNGCVFCAVVRPEATIIDGSTQTQNKRIHETSMSEAGFEPTITPSERAKTANALQRSATVTGLQNDLQ
jgi:hypothetical protein